MATPLTQADAERVECGCLEQVLVSLLAIDRSQLETGLGDLRQMACRSCGLTFVTNDQSAVPCPECQ